MAGLNWHKIHEIDHTPELQVHLDPAYNEHPALMNKLF